MYVWFDALLNYVTALGFAREGEDLPSATARQPALDGEGILKFHAVIWQPFSGRRTRAAAADGDPRLC